MRNRLHETLFFLSVVTLPAHAQGPNAVEASTVALPPAPLRVERGPEQLALIIPRAEQLHFRARLGSSDDGIGRAVLTSEVTTLHASGCSEELDGGEGQEAALLSIAFEADHSLYSIDAKLETRVLPQEWPRILSHYARMGENPRRREVLIGHREGAPTVCYRSDTDERAPDGTPVWRDDRFRSAPADVLDTVSAIHLARTFALEGVPAAEFPVIDRLQLWQMRARRGKETRIHTPAGTFDAVAVELEPHPWPGEERDEDGDRPKFKGLFGIRGTIRVWFEKYTGTPVRIEGEVPVGPMDFDVVIELVKHTGAPPEFRPIEERAGG